MVKEVKILKKYIKSFYHKLSIIKRGREKNY